MSLQPGDKLGPYEIVELVGRGGMGEVWKARDTRLNRVVAIKRLKGAHSARFEQEARAVAALNHPHICQIYDVGPDYFVTEYIEGTPLRGPLPTDDTVRLAIEIAEALIEAHGRRILHRDLKPGNILITAKGSAKLLDFGLAKMAAEGDATQTLTGAVMGTPLYMAPEQAEGRPVDERSDVFSFGAVLYEMLTGRRAFDSLAAVLRDEPAPPPALAAIIMRCLAKNPQHRFQSIAELRAALAGQARELPHSPSIAVLPFADMSPGRDHEYFSDGLAEEIINALAQISELKVIARTSAFAFRGQNTDIRRIAEVLGVTNILEGSVRRSGSRVRVTAQLIAASDGSHLWSRRYDRELADVFAVQDEIAAAITEALQVKLAVTPRKHTPKMAAYEAFLKGRHHWAKLTPESLELSRNFYEQAVALDPQFALARNALAEHFLALAANGLMLGTEAAPLVRSGALDALTIDSSLAESHALLGILAAFVDHDCQEALRQFQLATAHQPVSPYVRWLHGQFLGHVRKYDEAIQQLQQALQADPLHLLCRSHLAQCLRVAGNREAAV